LLSGFPGDRALPKIIERRSKKVEAVFRRRTWETGVGRSPCKGEALG